MELKACPHRDKEQFTIWQGEHRTRVYKCTCPDLKLLHDLADKWHERKARKKKRKENGYFDIEDCEAELRKALKQMEGK